MWTDLQEYESLRVVAPVQGGRMGSHPNLVQSGPDRTIVLSQHDAGAYLTFRIIESGLEIPVTNVSGATPKGVPLANKLRKTGPQEAPKPKKPPTKRTPKNVPRRVADDVLVQPKRRPGQTPSVVHPVAGVEDGED